VIYAANRYSSFSTFIQSSSQDLLNTEEEVTPIM